jgi:hypothetical protein
LRNRRSSARLAGALLCSSSTPNSAPPQAPDEIAAAAGVAQQAGKQLQGTVSGLVAVGVVDLLEVVQVQHQRRHGQLVACGMCQQAAALGGEAASVEHAGEAIGHRQRAQLVFGL